MLIAAWPAHAAIAHVQTVSCIASAQASCTTSPTTTTSGNLFIASSSYCCAAFVSVTDSNLNSYTNSISPIADGGGGNVRQDYKEAGVGGASHTFTLTGASGSFFGTLSVSEISGAASSPLDQTATGGDSGTSHTTASTGTTAQANELLLGFGGSSFVTTFTTDSGAGWTERTNIATDASTEGLITGTRIVSATGTFAYTFTSGTSTGTTQGISTWKESANRQRCIGCGTDKKVIGE